MIINIKQKRKENGLSQSDFASKLGVKQNTVSCWERGLYLPSFEMLLKMSKIFNCTIDELIKDEDEDVKIQEKQTG